MKKKSSKKKIRLSAFYNNICTIAIGQIGCSLVIEVGRGGGKSTPGII
jgi:hypothetical protein